METGTKMGPEAAGTAFRTRDVPLRKETVLLCLKSEGVASEFFCVGGAQ
jgi:hypothetical protein